MLLPVMRKLPPTTRSYTPEPLLSPPAIVKLPLEGAKFPPTAMEPWASVLYSVKLLKTKTLYPEAAPSVRLSACASERKQTIRTIAESKTRLNIHPDGGTGNRSSQGLPYRAWTG